MATNNKDNCKTATSWVEEDPPHIPHKSIASNDNNNDNITTYDDVDDTYIQSSAATCPPLIKLQFYGMCCPFLETEEEHDARDGYSNLQNYPITWYRKKLLSDVANDVKGIAPTRASGLINGIGQLFSGSGVGGDTTASHTSSGSSTNKQHTKQQNDSHSIPMTYVGVMATISIIDTDDHGPIIQIRSLDGWNDPTNIAAQKAVNDYLTSGVPWWDNETFRDTPPTKIIPLYMVDKIASGWSITNDGTAGGVKLYGAPQSKGLFSSNTGPELLRFDTLGGGGSTISDALYSSGKPTEPNKYSDKIILQLRSLIDWNRGRMARDIKRGKVGVAPKSNSPGYVTMS